ncbi:MAG TPA: hypothetical protein VFF06_15660 [Polyangia bacterium]|nr:hypothetical protein [Polyangia bacterium]
MKRRGFLAGAAALALGALDPFARRARADVSLRAPTETALEGAIRRARKSGRPLLALVIPREYGDTLERGHAFGEWLTHGGDADLAPLVHCEVACAPSAEVERLIGPAGAGEPLLVFAEYDRAPSPRVQRLEARLPDVPWLCLECADQSGSKRAADRVIDQRIALFGGWVRACVARRDPALAVEPSEPAAPLADARVNQWAAEVRAALRERAPAGSRWAWAEQFGSARFGVEPPPERAVEFIAKRTQRVLYLFDD